MRKLPLEKKRLNNNLFDNNIRRLLARFVLFTPINNQRRHSPISPFPLPRTPLFGIKTKKIINAKKLEHLCGVKIIIIQRVRFPVAFMYPSERHAGMRCL